MMGSTSGTMADYGVVIEQYMYACCVVVCLVALCAVTVLYILYVWLVTVSLFCLVFVYLTGVVICVVEDLNSQSVTV